MNFLTAKFLGLILLNIFIFNHAQAGPMLDVAAGSCLGTGNHGHIVTFIPAGSQTTCSQACLAFDPTAPANQKPFCTKVWATWENRLFAYDQSYCDDVTNTKLSTTLGNICCCEVIRSPVPIEDPVTQKLAP